MSVPIIKEGLEYTIYRRIPILAEAKGIKLNGFDDMDATAFNNKMLSVGMFDYKGTKNGKTYYIIMMTKDSRYIKKAELNKLINNEHADFYIIIFTTNITVSVDDKTKRVLFVNGVKSMIRNYIEYLKNMQISTRVLTDEEKSHYMHMYKFTEKNLPKIKENSIEVLYSSAERGDVVEIIHPTMTMSKMTGTIRLVI